MTAFILGLIVGFLGALLLYGILGVIVEQRLRQKLRKEKVDG